ncbi:uncharacterized protein MYCFIDRAFT_37438 [Pseudocercospora fijiensis CIRAD86]|uniref:FAD-binding domain-containing protein n=1 Tax=Pseudocercospora fijiensis (strain CIRAD86) TaxID=383855 RepID=M2ZLG5_PSEFD|nr:uncharacterized protein MYCFIDRAFT_37438 [Pseudocercospora fijiensis CIRAD86]EME79919.1 hypothetical protein MYCFIDRAFT_37438 [Pseudocercospora fijiensis CIRAD86]
MATPPNGTSSTNGHHHTSSPQPDSKIAIIGAGVGGLVTALQLHAQGFKNISLYEAASQITCLGVGINVQPSAVLILRNLGLLPALQNTGIETQELNFYDRFGNEILREKRGRYAGYEVPQESHLNHCLSTFSNEGDGVRLEFVQRKTSSPALHASVTADLVVAADGINSTVRRILYPNEGPPHFSGRILWRGCLESDQPFLTGASMIWSGYANQKFIAYPILKYPTPTSNTEQGDAPTGKTLINWIAELRTRSEEDCLKDPTPPEKTDWLKSVPKERFSHEFKNWSFKFLDVPDLIEKTEKVFEFPMCDRTPVDRWTFGHLTLLGDAAHPMYPIGSNGASQAILDSASLVQHLLNPVFSIREALKAYQNERLPATAKIVYANRGNGPDHVMQVVYERAPEGFGHINDVISNEELEDIGKNYKMIAGFDLSRVNELARKTEGENERLGLRCPKNWEVVNGL